MASRFFGCLLILGCAVLAGCSSGEDANGKGQSTIGEDPIGTPSFAVHGNIARTSIRRAGRSGLAADAVVVAGPLVYTRQVLPVDEDGNLVGEGSIQKQIDQVLVNLESVLVGSGSRLDWLAKLNIYADSPETVDKIQEQLTARLSRDIHPAVCAVISPLPLSKAHIAVDVVAIADEQGEKVLLQHSDGVESDKDRADAAVMPRGGVVYLSGQAEKGPLAEATAKSMTTLLDVIGQLELQPSQIVQLKVFVDSASASDTVLTELKKLFPDQMLPPVTFVEWIASAPVEIEAVVHLPRTSWHSEETLHFYTPPGVKPSPTFSKVAIVQSDSQTFISGLSARDAGGGEDQVRDVFDQLKQILSATGSDLESLAKATYYVSDQDASDKLNQLRPEYYDPQRPPAASKAMVHGVGRADRSFAMDMIVVGEHEARREDPEDSP